MLCVKAAVKKKAFCQTKLHVKNPKTGRGDTEIGIQNHRTHAKQITNLHHVICSHHNRLLFVSFFHFS